MGSGSHSQDPPGQRVTVAIDGVPQQGDVTWGPPTAGSSAARLTEALGKRHGWKPEPMRRPQRSCGARRRGAGRPAGRPRAQASRSSAASGDSPSDPEPPWLPGHGDVEGVGDPPPDPIANIALRVWWGAWIDGFGGFEVVL
jgi:hypothetical protein